MPLSLSDVQKLYSNCSVGGATDHSFTLIYRITGNADKVVLVSAIKDALARYTATPVKAEELNYDYVFGSGGYDLKLNFCAGSKPSLMGELKGKLDIPKMNQCASVLQQAGCMMISTKVKLAEQFSQISKVRTP